MSKPDLHETYPAVTSWPFTREDSVEVTHGTERISLSIRPGRDALGGTGTSIIPEVARALAADLIARADEIERRV